MASFYSNSSNGWRLRLDLTASAMSVENNTHTINWALVLEKIGNNDFVNYATYSATIDGTVRVSVSGTQHNVSAYGNVTLSSGSFTTTHEADGSKSLPFSASFALNASNPYGPSGTLSLSGSMELPTIPRATQPSTPNGTLGTAQTISTPPASSTFTHTLKYSFHGASGTIATGVGSSYSWTPPISLVTQLAAGSIRGICRITCDTYSGSKLVGSKYVDIYLYVPVATSPTSPNGTLGSALRVTMTPSHSSYTHVLKYKFVNSAGTISSNAGTSYDWTPPLSLASQIPSATSGTVTITVDTMYGTWKVGTRTITKTLSVPATVVPSITSITLSEYVANVASKFSVWVQNKSRARVQTVAAGAYGSTISRIEVTAQSVVFTGSNIITGVLNKAGNTVITIKVTDSRGRSVSTTRTLAVIAWAAPRIISFSARRAYASGTLADDGWNARLYYNYSISPVSNQNNHAWAIQRWTGASWTGVTSGTGYSANTNFLSGAIFDPDQSYRLRLLVSDYFTTSISEFTMPTSSSVIDFKANKKGLAIGKASELDALEVAWNAHFTGAQLTHNGSQVLTEADNGLQYRGTITDLDLAKTLPTGIYLVTTDTLNNNNLFYTYAPVLLLRRFADNTGVALLIGRAYGSETVVTKTYI